jgi:SSS family solute:Na+ symporter
LGLFSFYGKSKLFFFGNRFGINPLWTRLSFGNGRKRFYRGLFWGALRGFLWCWTSPNYLNRKILLGEKRTHLGFTGGRKYGKSVKDLISFLSWFWMVGVIASQILGGAYILRLTGISIILSFVITTVVITTLSFLPIEKLSKIFLTLLIASTGCLLYFIIKNQAGISYLNLIASFPKSVSNQNLQKILGVLLPTALVTFIGMDFQQFIVAAKDKKSAIFGTLLGGLILIPIAFVPVAVVVIAKNIGILDGITDGKEAIPLVIKSMGNGGKLREIFFILALYTAALGSGAGVNKIILKTFSELSFVPEKLRQKKITIAIANAILVALLAVTGKTIIGLIVSFYSVYVAGVFPAFIANLIAEKSKKTIPSKAIKWSIIAGSVASLLMVILIRIFPSPVEPSFLIISFGILISVVAFLMSL